MLIALKRTSGNSRELEETPKTSMMTKAIGDTALVASKDLRVTQTEVALVLRTQLKTLKSLLHKMVRLSLTITSI